MLNKVEYLIFKNALVSIFSVGAAMPTPAAVSNAAYNCLAFVADQVQCTAHTAGQDRNGQEVNPI